MKIKNPGGDNQEVFRNRKGVFSLNCQVACNPEMLIISANVRWPGSTHDSRIFTNSALKRVVENMQFGHLLGDSGYPLKPFLMTPFLNPSNNAENKYNKAHSGTRMVIECCFGILKKRFACLDKKLNTKIETTISIIISCFVLHNFCISHNDVWAVDDFIPAEILPIAFNGNQDGFGRLRRQHIVDNYFN